ncbi:MAG: glycosyltransferase [Actinomycetota bacterium]|nr:glycosyltransferase [Actinomycetota bacterium]
MGVGEVAEAGATGRAGAPPPPLRVLQVIKSLGRGGAERLVVDLVAAADTERVTHEVAFVLASEDALVPDLEAHGVAVRSLGATGNRDLRWTVALRRLLVAGRYDAVHFHLPYAAAVGNLVVSSLPSGRRPGVVYTEHCQWDEHHRSVRLLLRLSSRSGWPVVAVSRAAYDALPPALRTHAQVVVHGIDQAPLAAAAAAREEARNEIRRELDVDPATVLVAIVANLRAQKGHEVLLEATRLLAERGVPVRVVAAGDGPLRDELLARRHALGLDDRVAFLGARPDAVRLMAGADILALSSHYEGLPVVLMEASGLGLPVVATAVGGIPEVLTDGADALLVPPGDASALADALERMALDDVLRARLGAAFAAQAGRFDIAHTEDAMETLYRQVAPR